MNRLTILLGIVSAAWGQQVIATGLQTPQRFVLTSRGNFLVSETSTTPNSGRVSFVSRSGTRRTLIANLPSGAALPGDAAGPTGLALRDRFLFLAIGVGDAERPGTQPGTVTFNPAGMSSPLFSSVLVFQFRTDPDFIVGTFSFTPEIQRRLSDGEEVTLEDGAGGRADVSVLANLPDAIPDPNSIYRFSNPWGIELSRNGRTLYVADASTNALVSIDTLTGRWERLMRFAPIPNSSGVGPPFSDAVPTSVRLYGNSLLVSFLSGFPFVPSSARVLRVQPSEAVGTPFIWNLTAVTDVLYRPRSGSGRPQFFVIEHSTNMRATPRAPGRLIRFDTPDQTVVSSTLSGPVCMALEAETNTLFVLQLSGSIVEFKL